MHKPLLSVSNNRVDIRYSASRCLDIYPRWKAVMEAGLGGWAWWEKGRLAAITAEEVGQFVTFEVQVMGRELRLNARTPRAGMIKVELLDQSGRSLSNCHPLSVTASPTSCGGKESLLWASRKVSRSPSNSICGWRNCSDLNG